MRGRKVSPRPEVPERVRSGRSRQRKEPTGGKVTRIIGEVGEIEVFGVRACRPESGGGGLIRSIPCSAAVRT